MTDPAPFAGLRVALVGGGRAAWSVGLEIARRGVTVCATPLPPADLDSAELAHGLREAGARFTFERSISAAVPGAAAVLFGIADEIGPDGRVQRDARDRALCEVAALLDPGALLVVTAALGVGELRTRILPLLERATGGTLGQRFHLAYSPDRSAHGEHWLEQQAVPRLVGALDAASLDRAQILHGLFVVGGLVCVEPVELLELARAGELAAQAVSAAFATELMRRAEALGLDADRVRLLANTFGGVPVPPAVLGASCREEAQGLAALATGSELAASAGRVLRRTRAEVLEEIDRALRAAPRAEVVLHGPAPIEDDPFEAELRALLDSRQRDARGTFPGASEPVAVVVVRAWSPALRTELERRAPLLVVDVASEVPASFRERCGHRVLSGSFTRRA